MKKITTLTILLYSLTNFANPIVGAWKTALTNNQDLTEVNLSIKNNKSCEAWITSSKYKYNENGDIIGQTEDEYLSALDCQLKAQQIKIFDGVNSSKKIFISGQLQFNKLTQQLEVNGYTKSNERNPEKKTKWIFYKSK
jgi:hypothetical protein